MSADARTILIDPRLTDRLVTDAESSAQEHARRLPGPPEMYLRPLSTVEVWSPNWAAVAVVVATVAVCLGAWRLHMPGTAIGVLAALGVGVLLVVLSMIRQAQRRNADVAEWRDQVIAVLLVQGMSEAMAKSFLAAGVPRHPIAGSKRVEVHATFDHGGNPHEALMVVEHDGSTTFECRQVPRPTLGA